VKGNSAPASRVISSAEPLKGDLDGRARARHARREPLLADEPDLVLLGERVGSTKMRAGSGGEHDCYSEMSVTGAPHRLPAAPQSGLASDPSYDSFEADIPLANV